MSWAQCLAHSKSSIKSDHYYSYLATFHNHPDTGWDKSRFAVVCMEDNTMINTQ